MTKDQVAKAIYEKMMENDHYSQWLDIEPLLISEGHCKLKMKVRKEMLNGHALLHGGVAFAFADSALAFASNSYGRLAVTIEANMQFPKSAKVGDTLIAEATPLDVSHRTAQYDVNVSDEASKEIIYRLRSTVYRTSQEMIV